MLARALIHTFDQRRHETRTIPDIRIQSALPSYSLLFFSISLRPFEMMDSWTALVTYLPSYLSTYLSPYMGCDLQPCSLHRNQPTYLTIQYLHVSMSAMEKKNTKDACAYIYFHGV